eukprot:15449581-Alexandrium_andersonii.AAC.1
MDAPSESEHAEIPKRLFVPPRRGRRRVYRVSPDAAGCKLAFTIDCLCSLPFDALRNSVEW